MKPHPQESAISIVHHGRDREKLLPIVYANHVQEHGNTLGPRDELFLSRRALKVMAGLTPRDETKIRADSILKYIDLDKVEAPGFLYTFTEVEAAVARLWRKRPELEDDITGWLLGRGVTEAQLGRFRSFSQVGSRADRIALGIEIHPAIKRWIGDGPLRGVAYPSGRGCHLRFLSTVPKVKFGASVPLLHVSSNISFTGPEALAKYGLWIVEGIFDGLALDRLGIPYCAPSSGTWSAEQLSILVSTIRLNSPSAVILAHDRDRVGLKENLFLWSVLQEEAITRIFLYPEGVKDMAELVCKHGLDPRDIGPSDPLAVAELYLATPYEPLVDFDRYLDHRNTAYSNDRYAWSKSNSESR